MKLLHTADWHLGKRLDNYSRLDEQRAVMEEICEIAESHDVDAVLIAGDLFDTFNPPTEAVDLFYKTLKRLANNGHRAVIAIAGNHDSPDRIEAPDPLARACGIMFSGYPNSVIPTFELDSGLKVLRSSPGFIELKLPRHEEPLRALMTPYANEYRLRQFLGLDNEEEELRQLLQKQWSELANEFCDDRGVNVLVTHLFMIKKGSTPPPEPEDERPILHVGGVQSVYTENIPKQIQYAALGHLHRYIEMDREPCPVIYSSSPLSYSFAEAEQQKFVVVLDASAGQPVEYQKVPLKSGKPLLRRRFEDTETAVIWLRENQSCLVELTMATESYLSSADRKVLSEVHNGIITIIPELSRVHKEDSNIKKIDLNDDIDGLFRQYFQSKHQLPPDEAMMALFQEIKAAE